MRIAVLSTSYPRFPGEPAGPFVAALGQALVNRGHQVEVLAAGTPGLVEPSRQDLRELTVRRVSSTLFYAGGAPDALAGDPRAWVEALRFSGRFSREFAALHRRYDALISHWLLPCGVLGTVLAGSRPHVAIAHSSDVHLLRRLRMTALVRLVAARARLVYSAQSLVVPGAPGRVVPMGIDCAGLAVSDEERQTARQGFAVDRPTVLFLGRLVPVKGVAVLLSALAAVPEPQLWIAGDGPLRPHLQAQAQALGLGARVQFLGTVVGHERRRRLAACDLLAVPSIELPDGRTEGAPQVVLEGLAAGAHVLGSRVGGIPDLLGPVGQLVTPGDVAAWCVALRQGLAVTQGPTAAAQRYAARCRAAQFDWSRIAEQIVGPEIW